MDSLEEVIFKYKIERGYTSLAIGADQIFAELLRNNGIPYTAIIPSNKYESTFKKENLNRYFDLLTSAQNVIYLSFNEPCECAFYEAGKRVSDSSDVIIAVWNGQKARGLGGTGDIVEYSNLKNKKVIHINPVTHKISLL